MVLGHPVHAILSDLPATLIPANYDIDWSSVETLAPMFTLGGSGLGSATLDLSQPPEIVDRTARKIRYWITGSSLQAVGAGC